VDFKVRPKEEFKKSTKKLEEEDKWEDLLSDEDSKSPNGDRTASKINQSYGVGDMMESAPRMNTKKLERMNTLRIQKIQQILNDKAEIQGVKIFDLHLLNMKK